MKTKTKLFGLGSILIVAVFAFFFFWCSGTCESRECTVNKPCIVKGKKYVRGNICVNENIICDEGYVFDCHCKTRIIGAGPANNRPTCDCS